MTDEQTRMPPAVASDRPALAAGAPSEPAAPLQPAAPLMAAAPLATTPRRATGVATESKNVWERYGWLMAVVWMVFLIYPIVALLRSDAALGWIIVGWAALVLFAVLYVVGFIRGLRGGGGLGSPPVPGQWAIFAALIVCALASIPAEGLSTLSFLPFIMSFASYGLTRLAHWVTTLGSVAVTAASVMFVANGSHYSQILVIVTLLGVVNTVSTWLIMRSAEAEELGRELATSEGREGVARDVHDLIGHSLTVVQLKAQLARRLIDTDPERAKAELADIEALTSESIAGVRATVSGARATTFVEQIAASREALRTGGVDVRVEGEADALSPAQALTASWVLREATTNVLRHAKASSVVIRVEPGVLVVEDDGRGLRGGHADSRGGRRNGVAGMRERAAAAGADFAIGSEDDAGTRVELTW